MYKRQFIPVFILCFLAQIAFSQSSYEAFTIGFYNLENLFDVVDDDDVRDTEFTPDGKNAWTTERYEHKLKNMAEVISKLGIDMSPDGVACLGVSEIENKGVLEDLVKEPLIASRNYQIIQYDSPDKRGIDVALLYNPSLFTPKATKAFPLLIEVAGERKYTRDVLHVQGDMAGEEVNILVNHWPSRSGGEKRSSPLRKAAATLNAKIVDSLYAVNPNAKIFIVGDLNDDPSSPSIKKILKAQKKSEKTKPGGLYNPMYSLHQRGEGSNAWRDTWSLFDQIIVSEPLLDKQQSGLFFHKAVIFKEPQMVQGSGRYKGYPMRTYSGGQFTGGYSDHFPVVAYLLRKI